MNRNQKIALGCGGAGCLGLIVVAIAGGVLYFFSYRQSSYRASRDDDFNINVNRNSNANSATNSNSSSSDSSSSLSDDEKHKLFQAASATGDGELLRRVLVKLELTNEDYTPGEKYQDFMEEHVTWAARNYEFVLSINTPAKARAYVNEHFPD
jgi:hypothetical protein